MNKIQGVYKIINCTNNKVYIGQSIDIGKRLKQHKLNSKYNIKHPLYNSIKCYGIDNFEFIILEKVQDVSKLDEREQYWMDHYKSYIHENGYNLYKEASSPKGYKRSEIAKLKQSIIMKGKKKPPFTEEHRLNLSLSHKGKPSGRKGKKASEETKRKMSLARKGKKKKPFTEEHVKNLRKSWQLRKLEK